MELTEFLNARITEDEVNATLREWHTQDCQTIPDGEGYSYPCDCGVPERMKAECEAKRRIVEMDNPSAEYPDFDGGHATAIEEVMGHMAAVYADHPDYQQEWKP